MSSYALCFQYLKVDSSKSNLKMLFIFQQLSMIMYFFKMHSHFFRKANLLSDVNDKEMKSWRKPSNRKKIFWWASEMEAQCFSFCNRRVTRETIANYPETHWESFCGLSIRNTEFNC